MKNNKILMSLVAASIAAMAAAPELLKTDSDQEKNTADDNKKIIDINKQANLTPEQEELSKDAQTQVSALLSKKAPVMKVSESVSILVDNYGSNNESTKEKIYKDLQLAQVGHQDSTSVGTMGASGTRSPTPPGGPAVVCHSACHGACHAACHGSRGWR